MPVGPRCGQGADSKADLDALAQLMRGARFGQSPPKRCVISCVAPLWTARSMTGDAIDEAGDRFEHRVGLVAMRRMPAILELDELDVARAFRDTRKLVHRAVFVVLALNREHGAGDSWQILLDVPAAE